MCNSSQLNSNVILDSDGTQVHAPSQSLVGHELLVKVRVIFTWFDICKLQMESHSTSVKPYESDPCSDVHISLLHVKFNTIANL